MKKILFIPILLIFQSCFNPIYDNREELLEYHIGKWQVEIEQKTHISSIKKDKVEDAFDFIMEESGLAYKITSTTTIDGYHWTFNNNGEWIAISSPIVIDGVETLETLSFEIQKQDDNNQKWEREFRNEMDEKVTITWQLKRI
ncbi:MAG: hypothetical protein AB8G11_23490 [Saprospiraceae bacterium]